MYSAGLPTSTCGTIGSGALQIGIHHDLHGGRRGHVVVPGRVGHRYDPFGRVERRGGRPVGSPGAGNHRVHLDQDVALKRTGADCRQVGQGRSVGVADEAADRVLDAIWDSVALKVLDRGAEDDRGP